MSVAALYLHLRARGLKLALVDRPECPDSYMISIRGLKRLEPDDSEQPTTSGLLLPTTL